ncbi:MAG: ribulose-phosphate 3-epimerase, partial [Pseudomonadota bacterium]
RRIKEMIGDRPIHIEVDGGIHRGTAPLVAEAGANALVSGSGVFDGGNYHENIKALRDAAMNSGTFNR